VVQYKRHTGWLQATQDQQSQKVVYNLWY